MSVKHAARSPFWAFLRKIVKTRSVRTHRLTSRGIDGISALSWGEKSLETRFWVQSEERAEQN